MAIADKYGPGDGKCIALARMASQAVDFVKTGVAVPSQEIPVIEEYPDFMGKDYKQIRVFKKEPINNYPSEKVLGMMFREIDPEPQFNSSHNYKGDHDLFTLDEPKEWRAYLSQVAASKAQYDYHVTGLLRRYFTIRQIAVREAYQVVAASAKKEIREYMESHSVTGQAQLDHRAWALCAYKLTHDPELFVQDLGYNGVDVELLIGDLDDLGAEIADRNLHEIRLYSYPWLFASELVALKRSHSES
ncbi:hypothetical protein EIP86_004835 [Pleurotus ostreatoroseus]|nr:hypothetical protein EIP86_004835 [Pleurotus ostreatoroseus]